jgi:predicted DNA-binding ArsR family transcriptional regulator
MGRATRNNIGESTRHIGLLDNVSYLEAAWGASMEGLNPPKRPLSYAYKASRRSPLC